MKAASCAAHTAVEHALMAMYLIPKARLGAYARTWQHVEDFDPLETWRRVSLSVLNVYIRVAPPLLHVYRISGSAFLAVVDISRFNTC